MDEHFEITIRANTLQQLPALLSEVSEFIQRRIDSHSSVYMEGYANLGMGVREEWHIRRIDGDADEYEEESK